MSAIALGSRSASFGSLDKAVVNHYDFIDNAKAIGIVLIVLGHSKGLPEYLSHLVFGFHVPLFFFISGFLIKSNKLETSIVDNAKKVLQYAGVPYVLFFIVAYIYWLGTRSIGAKALMYVGTAWYVPVWGLFTGLVSDLYVDPPLWFFPCFISTVIVYHASRKLLSTTISTWLFVVLAAAISLLWKTTSPQLPFGLSPMLIALAFYSLGQAARTKNYFLSLKSAHLIFGFLIALALLAYAVSKTGLVDLASMNFGLSPKLYLLTAMLGIFATFSISRLLPSSRITRWLSANTLTIFPLHFIFFSLIRGVATSLHLIPHEYHYGLGWSLMSSIFAILLCVPAVYMLRLLRLPKESFGRMRGSTRGGKPQQGGCKYDK
ncbi:acyltransferase family protein [Glaciimonas immobilis]|uniref:Acyltransferase n=1 Tax=Glaciimonas immobilis TaxID=728004 RepID=A0A840RYY9_9BURK|nr:acyltransferase family protein [Glaciimonas immobilis]KAF3998254.1 acyltransferase family protein [Glaciimonas immobilis]MBB5201864.1 acyltransferase [Glaciimonas immobilis]